VTIDVLSEPAEQYASEEEREWTAGVLRANHTAGRLTVTEFEERLKKAYAGRTIGELRETLANLPLPEPGQPPPPVSPPLSAGSSYEGFHSRHRHEHARSSGLPGLAITYTVTAVLLVGIWLFSGMGYAWFIWPLLGGGLVLATRAATQLGGVRK
jgi:hypothetical protein